MRFWLKVMVKIVYSSHMGAEIINLRQVRKQQKRAEAADTAAENRARHGRTKSARQKDEMEAGLKRRELDGHKLDSKSDKKSDKERDDDK